MKIRFLLIKKLIMKTGKCDLRIISDSMYPFIYKNRDISIKPEKKYNIGDAIVFYNEDEDALTCHRIIQKRRFGDTYGYITKGDNCSLHDKRLLWDEYILGKVFSIRYRKKKEKICSIVLGKINQKKTQLFFWLYKIKYIIICFIIERGERV